MVPNLFFLDWCEIKLSAREQLTGLFPIKWCPADVPFSCVIGGPEFPQPMHPLVHKTQTQTVVRSSYCGGRTAIYRAVASQNGTRRVASRFLKLAAYSFRRQMVAMDLVAVVRCRTLALAPRPARLGFRFGCASHSHSHSASDPRIPSTLLCSHYHRALFADQNMATAEALCTVALAPLHSYGHIAATASRDEQPSPPPCKRRRKPDGTAGHLPFVTVSAAIRGNFSEKYRASYASDSSARRGPVERGLA